MEDIYVLKQNCFNKYLWTEEQQELVVKLYQEEGKTKQQIADMFHVCSDTIKDVLNKKKVPNNRYRKYTLDEHYFDQIDTPNKAYILGFLFSDGSNRKSGRGFTIGLKEDDQYILDRMRDELKSNRRLTHIDHSRQREDQNSFNSSDQVKLEISSTYMSKQLSNLGMVPNKTYILKYPECIPKELDSHFIRGYIDGDGSIVFYRTKRGSYEAHINVVGTLDMCQEILSRFHEVGVTGGSICPIYSSAVTYQLTICNQKNFITAGEWLYKDADMFLERKYEKYIAGYNYIIEHNSYRQHD